MKELNMMRYKKEERPLQIVQFGEGNFLRAFVDWMISEMNHQQLINSGVALVQPLENGRIKNLQNSDGLYTLILEGLENGEIQKSTQIIDVLDEFNNPYKHYDEFLILATNPNLKMVISNTTESGIVLDNTDIDFTKTPTSFPGKLLSFLHTRYTYFNGDVEKGLFIVPCELIDNNAAELKKVMIELATVIGFDHKFIDWISDANTFTSTLVDRIVTGYPANEIDAIQEELGYTDSSLVKGEFFHLWIIEENEELQKFFPADKAGLNVKFVKDIKPYKERKVKILNGSHTLMVPIGLLYGLKTVRETVENDDISRLLYKFLNEEVLKTIDLDEKEIKTFANQVIERFKNPFIEHQLKSISLNSTMKFKTRILPTITDYIEKFNDFPEISIFSLASLFVLFKVDEELVDDKSLLEMWSYAWSKYNGTKESIIDVVNIVLYNNVHWEYDLLSQNGILEFLVDSIDNILTLGMKEAIKNI